MRNSARPAISAGAIGTRRNAGSRASSAVDLLLAFLRLERAGAIDERAARLGQRDGAVEQPALQRGERGDVGLAA